MIKNKTFCIKLLESFILIVIFMITILPNTICKSVHLQQQLSKENTTKGFIKLKDNYDGIHSKISISEFFKSPDAIKKMEKLYNNINNNTKYYEILNQDLVYIGDYKKGSIFVSGMEENINQSINGNIITPLKSLQLGEKASTYLKIKDKINKGKYFLEKDYSFNSNSKVSVVLGALYSDIYKVGDSFEASYLNSMKLQCNVIGILKKDTTFYIDKKYNLDDKIIMPALNIKANVSLNDKSFQHILYSLKNVGYIPYNSVDEYNSITKIINKIVKEANINWSYRGKVNNPFEKNPVNLSIKMAKFIKWLLWGLSLILIIIIYKLEIQIYKVTNVPADKRERTLLQTKKSIIMALQISILYITTCLIMSICLKKSPMYFVLIRIQRQMLIFLLFGFISITYMLSLYIKKNIKTE